MYILRVQFENNTLIVLRACDVWLLALFLSKTELQFCRGLSLQGWMSDVV